MNLFEKLQKIKVELLDCNLKKSGKNKFANFDYYELSDIMPDIIRLCDKYKICTFITFENEKATLFAVDWEDKEPHYIKKVDVSSQIVPLEIRGANAIQALGGIQTYMRRYLYMAMFDITECDQFDALSGKKDEPKKYCCVDCGTDFKPFTSKDNKYFNAGQVYHMAESSNADKKARCKACKVKKEGESKK
ncbi:MAG: ERF family protein [Firmicutes bacterium]|nr:ERF family protein [Bacillota bacterium]